MKDSKTTRVLIKIVLCLLAVICALPMLLVLINSFKTHQDIVHNPLAIQFTAGLSNYVKAWTDGRFAQGLLNSVVYTGTHDNDTVRGWIDTADDAALAQARQLLGFDKPEDGPAAFVRAVLASRADTAMIPMQDVLGLGGWARMNRPGTIGNNWLWRMAPGAATPELAQRLRRENEATNRRMD